MSYELFYKIFTVKHNNKFYPFMVHGSNNCYEATGGRERNLSNAYFLFKSKSMVFDTLENLKQDFNLEMVNKELEGGNIQGRFKTANSMVKNFLKVIENSDLELEKIETEKNYAYYVYEHRIKQALKVFKIEKKQRNPYDIHKLNEGKEYLEFPTETEALRLLQGKKILAYDQQKNFMNMGTIRELFSGGFGLFPMRSKRRYLYIHRIYFYKEVK